MNREQRAESREQGTESREQRAESREQRAENWGRGIGDGELGMGNWGRGIGNGGGGLDILLGVTGSIAAYKAAEIANRLTKSGSSVRVIMTAAARRFITPLTFQTLTRHKVYTGLFDEITGEEVRHISLAKNAGLLLIAPATANIIGKAAAGIADDMLSTVLMAVRDKPVIICPAMNTAMYEHPATSRNIETLKSWGFHFVEPKESLLACGDTGKGALADIEDIINAVNITGKALPGNAF
jgi:phosphopantothenoylcysteine decarboxylase/phosphopantothenoylcysteine decarboxylase/phosphopantothenate--cysteine ligase